MAHIAPQTGTTPIAWDGLRSGLDFVQPASNAKKPSGLLDRVDSAVLPLYTILAVGSYHPSSSAKVLRAWIRVREAQAEDEKALFVGEKGKRIGRNIVYKLVTEAAERVGLHDPESRIIEL